MITFEQHLNLAAAASRDKSLIPNHLGTVDRRLKEYLDDYQFLEPLFRDMGDLEESSRLTRDIKRIQGALRAYENQNS